MSLKKVPIKLDFELTEDQIQNIDEYCFISSKIYKKNDPKVIKILGEYVLYDHNKHVKCFNDKFEYTNNAVTVKFYDKKEVLKEIVCTRHYTEDLLNEKGSPPLVAIFSQYYNTKKVSSISHLLNFLISIPGTPRTLIPYQQLEKFGIKRSLADGTLHRVLPKGSNKKLPNVYHRYNVKKLIRESEYNTNMIAKNNFTFGVELETSTGLITEYEAKLMNIDLESCRDGSISGGEYVTGILQHDQGFYDLYKLCSSVSKYCDMDSSCGMHVHIGNLYFNKLFNLAAYVLGVRIQNELFTFLHPSRSNNNMCGLLDETYADYTVAVFNNYNFETAKKLMYQFFYKKMTHGNYKSSKRSNKRFRHYGGRYADRYQRFNGAITPEQFRYKWLNFISCNFNQRGKEQRSNNVDHSYYTLEFRNYQATADYNEVRDWVLFCMAFVSYARNNYIKLLMKTDKVTIKDIVTASYPSLYERMLERKKNPQIGNKTKKEELSFVKLIKDHKALCVS